MFNRIKKRLGYHVCETFTPWETKTQNFSRPCTLDEAIASGLPDGDRKVEFTRRWQERCCAVCGRMEQRDLKY